MCTGLPASPPPSSPTCWSLPLVDPLTSFDLCLTQADLWSIGTILFELLVGKPPFNGANHLQLLRNIERGEAVLPEATAGRLSGACRGLLAGLLKRNPVERITFEEFFQHPFLLAERTGVREEGRAGQGRLWCVLGWVSQVVGRMMAGTVGVGGQVGGQVRRG